MLRELSEIVQMVLQVIIDAFYICLGIDMDKKMNRLKERYQEQVVPALTKRFGYKNPMQVPRLVSAGTTCS